MGQKLEDFKEELAGIWDDCHDQVRSGKSPSKVVKEILSEAGPKPERVG